MVLEINEGDDDRGIVDEQYRRRNPNNRYYSTSTMMNTSALAHLYAKKLSDILDAARPLHKNEADDAEPFPLRQWITDSVCITRLPAASGVWKNLRDLSVNIHQGMDFTGIADILPHIECLCLTGINLEGEASESQMAKFRSIFPRLGTGDTRKVRIPAVQATVSGEMYWRRNTAISVSINAAMTTPRISYTNVQDIAKSRSLRSLKLGFSSHKGHSGAWMDMVG
jgi:hypothetical protein